MTEDLPARTVELLPDEGTDAHLRASWARLAAAGLPSLGDHPHPTNRPHLTLAQARAGFPGDVEARLRDLLHEALPLDLRLGALGFFPTRRGLVVHRVVVPSPSLVALHAAVAGLLDEAGAEPADHLLPGSWTPHVSLALRAPVSDAGAYVALLPGDAAPTTGSFVAARSYTSLERTVATLAGPRG